MYINGIGRTKFGVLLQSLPELAYETMYNSINDSDIDSSDIDTAIKLGLNHPMGPFSLADFIGIDICIAIFKGFKDEKYKLAKMLYRMANGGKLGVKSGEGFYKY